MNCYLIPTAMSLLTTGNNDMITVLVKDFNTFTQEFYNSVIFNLPLHKLECSACSHSACLTIHGYYVRFVITPDGKVPLNICRVMCSECGRTHALLLSSLVAYSQIPVETQRAIAVCYEDDSNRSELCISGDGIDENNVKSVIRRYVRFWRERLHAVGVSLRSIHDLVSICFSNYSTQFMQIRSTFNILFSSPT